MSAGRPTDYSLELVDAICLRLWGGESLNSICNDPKMPAKTTVYRWLLEKDKEEFRDKYRQARELQADTFFDEAIDIADDKSGDDPEKVEGGASAGKLASENIQRSRLRVDTRFRIAAITRPRKYSEKNISEITGADGGPVEVATTERPKLSREEWLAVHGLDENGVKK